MSAVKRITDMPFRLLLRVSLRLTDLLIIAVATHCHPVLLHDSFHLVVFCSRPLLIVQCDDVSLQISVLRLEVQSTDWLKIQVPVGSSIAISSAV